MSVRRLADDAVQPDGFAYSPENDAWFEAQVKKYPEGRQRSAIIPALMRAQEQEGWVSKAAIEHIADRLDMPYIRALEVATFYTQFMLAPVGRRAHVQVCGTTPCMLRGSEELFAVCKRRIGPEALVPGRDGALSWEEVECQGACVNAPMVMIGKDAYEDLTPERLDEILTAFEEGRGHEVPTGPQNGRHLSAPIGGLRTLTDDDAVDEHAHDEAPLDDRPDTGEEDAVAPSEAARPDTFSQRTSPAYAPEGAPTVDPAVEEAASSDPDPGEKGVGAPRDDERRGADRHEPTIGTTPDGVHPPLDQKVPADPREAGEANREFAEDRIAAKGKATGGAQASTPTQSVHRDDDRMVEADDDTGAQDRARGERAGPTAAGASRPTAAGASRPTAAGAKADPAQVKAQRDARTPIGADGTAAGDGAASDPKARADDNTDSDGTGVRRQSGDPDATATTAGGVAAPPQNFVSGTPEAGGTPGTDATADDDPTVGKSVGKGTGKGKGKGKGKGTGTGTGAKGGRASGAAGKAPGNTDGADGADGMGGEPSGPAGVGSVGAAKAPVSTKGGGAADIDDDGPEAEPARLDAPREGGADDLKMIWGVGPKLETMLHEMGFYHFDQIAGWGEAELNWVDRRLTGFRGRARRDKWVEQAERLAGGWRPEQGHGESPH